MKEIKNIINQNKKRERVMERRWNGRIFTSNNGEQGMVCALVDAENYWVYWFNKRMLTHQETTVSKVSTDIRGGKKGDINYYDVPDDLHNMLMDTRQREEDEDGDDNIEPSPSVYELLEDRTLPGFLHCIELDDELNPKAEIYIPWRSVTRIVAQRKYRQMYFVEQGDKSFPAVISNKVFEDYEG